MQQPVAENRAEFLEALRSGDYPKGPIETDARGRPTDPNATGWCAVALAYTLFSDGVTVGAHKKMMDKLALTAQDLTRIQQEWNDSPLTFPQIADLIETEMFTRRPNNRSQA